MKYNSNQWNFFWIFKMLFFKKMKNSLHISICLKNIGCIMVAIDNWGLIEKVSPYKLCVLHSWITTTIVGGMNNECISTMGHNASIMNGIEKWNLLIYSKLHKKILVLFMLVFIVIYQLTNFSSSLGLCVFVAIFKLFNFVVGHMSLIFYFHFDAHGNV
jgi:hypothetical protein